MSIFWSYSDEIQVARDSRNIIFSFSQSFIYWWPVRKRDPYAGAIDLVLIIENKLHDLGIVLMPSYLEQIVPHDAISKFMARFSHFFSFFSRFWKFKNGCLYQEDNSSGDERNSKRIFSLQSDQSVGSCGRGCVDGIRIGIDIPARKQIRSAQLPSATCSPMPSPR